MCGDCPEIYIKRKIVLQPGNGLELSDVILKTIAADREYSDTVKKILSDKLEDIIIKSGNFYPVNEE